MDEFKRIYENNKRLDDIFNEKYLSIESEMFKKNAIEFLVELGEFVNESKCFKYWSIKTPKKEEMLEEFADCITMLLFFFNDLNISLKEEYNHIESKNVLDVINYLYYKGSKIISDYNKELLEDIYGNLLYLGKLFDFKDDEIILAIDNKQNKIEERLNSDY